MYNSNANTNVIGSSKTSRKSLRISSLSEIINQAGTIKDVSIPSKLTQAVTAGYSFFCRDINKAERLFHGVLTAITLTQFSLMVVMLYNDENCSKNSNSNLCKTSDLFEYIYIGLLVIGQSVSEISKKTSRGNDEGEEERDQERMEV